MYFSWACPDKVVVRIINVFIGHFAFIRPVNVGVDIINPQDMVTHVPHGDAITVPMVVRGRGYTFGTALED